MRVVLASEAVAERDGFRQAVLGMGLECAATDCVPYGDLKMRLSQPPPADLVLVVEGPARRALPAIEDAAKYATAPVLAVGIDDGPGAVLPYFRAGAKDFVRSDRFRDDLLRSLEKLRQSDLLRARQGRTVAVTSAGPGCGVTTAAAGLAFALAEKRPRHVVLAELGTGVPELALDLDLNPLHPLPKLLRDWERMDASMVRQAVWSHTGGVEVLAYQPETLAPEAVGPEVMRHAVVLLRAMYDFSVLDLGHSATPGTLEALRLADAAVVVVRLDVPGVRLARRYLRELTEAGVPGEKLLVVGNRYGQKGQVAWKKVEEELERPAAAWVPDDPATVNQALQAGQPLTQYARRAAITRRFAQLAQDLAARLSATDGGRR